MPSSSRCRGVQDVLGAGPDAAERARGVLRATVLSRNCSCSLSPGSAAPTIPSPSSSPPGGWGRVKRCAVRVGGLGRGSGVGWAGGASQANKPQNPGPTHNAASIPYYWHQTSGCPIHRGRSTSMRGVPPAARRAQQAQLCSSGVHRDAGRIVGPSGLWVHYRQNLAPGELRVRRRPTCTVSGHGRDPTPCKLGACGV